MDGPMFGGEHLGSPLRSPERRGESCIRPLCLIRPYAQKLRLHRAILLSGHFLFFLYAVTSFEIRRTLSHDQAWVPDHGTMSLEFRRT